jgi:CRISPR-associated protein Cas5d
VEHFNKVFCLEVAGAYACFTRPEMKVERVSYDVITPSAARAIFSAIFWKPAVRWNMKRIEVLEPIRWVSVRRNEVGAVMSPSSDGIYIEDSRQQRAGLFLRDVVYRLHAELEFIPPPKRPVVRNPVSEGLVDPEEAAGWKKEENPGKYYGIFERRARKGQCFHQPYLGCREFAASFRLVDEPEKERKPIAETRDLGFMLYDLDYADESDPKAAFFRARMREGTIEVPPWASEEVHK